MPALLGTNTKGQARYAFTRTGGYAQSDTPDRMPKKKFWWRIIPVRPVIVREWLPDLMGKLKANMGATDQDKEIMNLMFTDRLIE
jgi:hypothetical protein